MTGHARRIRRRGLPLAAIALLGLLLAACDEPEPVDDEPDDEVDAEQAEADYEVWALDQGTDVLHVLDPDGEVVDEVDLSDHVEVPHMVDFDESGQYAFVAATASGQTAVLRADDREVVAVLDTGPGSHMARPTPDGEAAWVSVIGDEALVEITADLDAEEFEVGRTVDIAAALEAEGVSGDFPSQGAVCHEYDAEGATAWVTLGPADGGVVEVDLAAAEVTRIHDRDELWANCGTLRTHDDRTVMLNYGDEGSGDLWRLDVEQGEVTDHVEVDGSDAHGLAFTPDGEELWQVNRVSDDGNVYDPDTLEVIDTFDFDGETPDIIWISPDGQRAWVTLRGPEPVSAAHVAEGRTSGVAVLDVPSRELIDVIELAPDSPESDFHGVWGRPLTG